jgi:hypothetical protein
MQARFLAGPDAVREVERTLGGAATNQRLSGVVGFGGFPTPHPEMTQKLRVGEVTRLSIVE